MLPCERQSFVEVHLPHGRVPLHQVGLVADEHDDNVRRKLPQLLNPRRTALECSFLGHVVDQQSSNRSPIVSTGNRAVPLFSCSVPQLHLHRLRCTSNFHMNGLLSKLYSNRGHSLLGQRARAVPRQKMGLPHIAVADKHNFHAPRYIILSFGRFCGLSAQAAAQKL